MSGQEAIELSKLLGRTVSVAHDDHELEFLSSVASMICYQDDRLGPFDLFVGPGWKVRMYRPGYEVVP